MSYQAKFHARAGSRSSLSSVVQMPIISEHGRAPLPSPPLRVPQKQSKKNGGSGSGSAKGSVTPPPPYAAFSLPGSDGTAPSTILCPPAPAVLHTDLKYTGDPEKMMLGDMKLDSPTEEGHSQEQDMSHWNKENRRRRCRFVGLVSFLVVIMLGLGIGLSVGLSNDSTSNSESSDYGDASMTGSFSFSTTLQQRSTGCTSNPTTWRCHPYSSDVTNVVQWSIDQVGPSNSNSSSHGDTDGDGEYRISSLSGASPAFPFFQNIPLTLLDSGLPSERFVFSFQMNKTVVPSTALASGSGSGSGTSCTYSNTTFQATLWTRRTSVKHSRDKRARAVQRRHEETDIEAHAESGSQNRNTSTNTSASTSRSASATETTTSTYPAWPGLVKISELVDSKRSSIVCRDSEGTEIGGTRAAEGTCGCVYRTPESS